MSFTTTAEDDGQQLQHRQAKDEAAYAGAWGCGPGLC